MKGSRLKQYVGARSSAPSRVLSSEVWAGQRGARVTLTPDAKAVAAIDLIEKPGSRQPFETLRLALRRKARSGQAFPARNASSGLAFTRSKVMKKALAQIAAYLSGRSAKFNFPIATDPNPFRAKVYAALRRVPAGQTLSYGDLARSAGFPGAARAVGTAMARNPLPLVVPCHRVIAAGGKLGGYGGGEHWKRWLLELEQKA